MHAFVHVDREGAVAQARAADTALAEGHDLGPMHGVPYALKDIFDVAGLPTTCHSKLRRGHVAERDSEVAARFRAGGAVLLGKLGTYEFAFGGPSFDLPFPPTRNPWNLDHVTGGSSSGSGRGVAAGFVRVAPGSCTAGSIRVPAAVVRRGGPQADLWPRLAARCVSPRLDARPLWPPGPLCRGRRHRPNGDGRSRSRRSDKRRPAGA